MGDIPKIIHGYWSQGIDKAPTVVARCWERWQQANPDWDLQLLDSHSAPAIFRSLGIDPKNISFQAEADIVRVERLCKLGGVWVDAATIPYRRLDDWIGEWGRSGFFAFHDPRRGRPVENFFLASEAGHPLSEIWLDGMRDYWSISRRPQRYSRELTKGIAGGFHRFLGRTRHAIRKGGMTKTPIIRERLRVEPKNYLVNGPPIYPYFWPHLLFAHLLRENDTFRQAWALVPKLPSYKELMIRHYSGSYDGMTDEEAASLVYGSRMQKLMLGKPPPDPLLNHLFDISQSDCGA